MQPLLQNLRFTLRTLSKQPLLALTILLTLAVGIGATTAIFTVDYATLIAPPPYPHPEQLVFLWSRVNDNHNVTSAGTFTDWAAQSHSFQKLAAQSDDSANVGSGDKLESINVQYVTPGFYDMLQGPGQMFLGRDLLPAEGVAGKDHVAVITHKLWEHLGADRSLATPLRINGEPYTVVGVLPQGQMDKVWSQIILPLVFKPEQLNHSFHWLTVGGRLKDGVTVAQAQADMDSVAANIARAHPDDAKNWGVYVDTYRQQSVGKDMRFILWLLLGACASLLLIACVNVANLLLARGIARQKEIALRTALGASRRAIFGQLLTESLVLSLAGGILGIAFGYAALRAIIAFLPEFTLPTEADLHLSLPVLLTTLAITTVTGILAGYAPAWFAARVNPNDALKEGGSSGSSVGRHRLRRILVVGEFALALALLTTAGLAMHSFLNELGMDMGIHTDHILNFYLSAPPSRPKDPPGMVVRQQQILDAIHAVPGVTSAGAATGNLLNGAGFGMPFTVVGKPAFADRSQRPDTAFGIVSPGVFPVFGLQVVRGRPFTDQDTASTVKVAVVNQVFADKYLKDVDPLTQRVSVEQIIPGVTKLGPPIEWQVIGVYRTIHRGPDDGAEMFIPAAQSPWPSMNYVVRSSQDPNAMIKSVAAAIHSVDPDVALTRPGSLDDVRSHNLDDERFILGLFAAFAAIALLLATLGIYGVMSFSVAQRTREIALRMALGADRRNVVSLILREGILLALIGSAIGLIGAFFIGRALQHMLYNIARVDYTVFAAVSALLLLAAIAACLLPAQRAANLNPMQSLKAE